MITWDQGTVYGELVADDRCWVACERETELLSSVISIKRGACCTYKTSLTVLSARQARLEVVIEQFVIIISLAVSLTSYLRIN